MINSLLVYGLRDPRTGEIRYVGKSTSGMSRPLSHGKLKSDAHLPSSRWVAKLNAMGMSPEVVVIEEVPPAPSVSLMERRKTLCERERWWIARGREAIGARLLNLAAGGDGGCGPIGANARAQTSARFKGRPKTAEQRKKMSDTRKALLASGAIPRPVRVGWNATDELRTKNLPRLSDLRCREYASGQRTPTKGMLGRRHSEESKRRMSESLESRIPRRGWHHSAEAKAKISAARKERTMASGWHHTEETKAKIGAANRRPKPRSNPLLGS